MELVLGIDIGGTNVAYGLVDRTGKIIFKKSIRTKDFSEPEDLVNEIYSVVSTEIADNKLLGIGIGAPNGNSKTGNIEFAPNLNWKGIVPIQQFFEKRFSTKALLANDANAAATGEKLFGSAKFFTDFITITLGTGLGSGIFINNHLIEGKHGFAGELGHVQFIQDGRLCKCGKKGCLETYASSTGVKRSFELFSKEKNYNSSLFSDKTPSAFAIFDAAKNGDELGLKIVDFTADILGRALACFTAFSDPEAFVLFGGIAQSGDFFRDKIQAVFDEHVLQIYKGKVQIVTSNLHSENAAILGVAANVFYSLN